MTDVHQDGRVALITGASGAIGAAVARLLASRGMRVVVNYRSSRNKADEVVRSIGSAGGEAMAAQADVRDQSAVLAMVEQARAAMGEVEVLVHCALMPYAIKSFDEMSVDELGGSVDREIRAAFVVTKAVVPGMTRRGYGRIVYLGAVLSRRPLVEGMIALGTSKAALGSFSRYVAEEVGPRGITVNVVAPGPVGDHLHNVALERDQEKRRGLAEETALGRIASPDDVARAVAFYAGDDSEFITGSTAPVNGGLAMN
jgi:3-oxoacyl-[acyl-carrier protein] reductase